MGENQGLAYVKSDLQIVGGPHGTADILVAPPWSGERAEAVLVGVTAWGNTAVNILYVTADSVLALMGAGAATLSQPTNGGVWVINGAGSLNVGPVALGVTQFLRVSPTAAASGQIYLIFYWQKVLDLAGPLHIPAPRPAHVNEEEEARVWQRVRGQPLAEGQHQNPAELPPEEQTALDNFRRRIDTRGQLRKMTGSNELSHG